MIGLEAFSVVYSPTGGFVPYREYITSQVWWDKSRSYRAMVGSCERCGAVSGLSVHHRHYQTLGRETPADLVCLCGVCHRQEHA